jgi:hypothetical protein
VSVVENDPRMMVLRYVGGLAPIKPLDSMSQGDHCSKWTGRYQGSRPPSRDPLETHQERQLPLHGFGQAQRMGHEAQHCDGGLLLAFARWSAAAIGWIRDEGSAAIGHNLARQEVYPGRPKAVISDVRGRYGVAVALQHGRDGAFLISTRPLAVLVRAKMRAVLAKRRPDLVLPKVAWRKPWVIHCTAWGDGAEAVLRRFSRGNHRRPHRPAR